MQPLKPPQLRPIPSTLKLQPRFWSSFTFMCKWVYFEAMKQGRVRLAYDGPGLPIREPQPVVFVGPHPRVREHARRMFDPGAYTKKLNHHG